MRTGVATIAALVVGMIFAPSLGATRHAESLSELLQGLTRYVSPVRYLSESGDVSAYAMLTLVWRWQEQFGYAWGSQIGSALLFWVPRAIWPGKSGGTGQMLATDLGFDFTNRAAPLVAEPLIDFGWIGVPVVAVLFAYPVSRLDRAFYAPATGELLRDVRVVDVLYPFLFGLMIFITRGDLITTLASTVGFVVAAIPLTLWADRTPAQAQEPVRPAGRPYSDPAPLRERSDLPLSNV